MNSILDSHRKELADACRRFDVEILEIFGSVARTDFDFEKSDVDFIVRFRNPGSLGYADRYLGLAEELERILGRPVDLLTERSLRNPLFIEQIISDRTVVYAA